VKVLNLYAGLGGNRRNWEGHEVTAVEYNEKIAAVYRENFPKDNLIVGDAHEYLLNHSDEYDFIWSSPPCQSHSKMVKATRHRIRKYPEMALYQEIIFLTHFCKGFWLVENVKPYYTPLITPSKVVGRHLFWNNFEIPDFKMPNHPNFIQGDSPPRN
jgi:DNA (cytosine-5)-methyltransferase 1